MIDYVGDLNRCANFHRNRLDMAAPTHTWNITTLWLLFSCNFFCIVFSQSRNGRTERRTDMHDGSNDAVWCKDVPFRGFVDVRMHQVSRVPKTHQVFDTYGNFKPKRKCWITFERKEIEKWCPQTTDTKVGSRIRMVTSLPACHTP
jgi:hypothetical protein